MTPDTYAWTLLGAALLFLLWLAIPQSKKRLLRCLCGQHEFGQVSLLTTDVEGRGCRCCPYAQSRPVDVSGPLGPWRTLGRWE